MEQWAFREEMDATSAQLQSGMEINERIPTDKYRENYYQTGTTSEAVKQKNTRTNQSNTK